MKCAIIDGLGGKFMNNNEFEYSEKTKRRVRIFKRILSFIVLILAIATMVALFYVKKEKMRVRLFFSLLQYIAMSIVLISPRLLKKFANFEVPVEVHISVTAFAFLGLVLGDGLNFYGKIGWWDSLLHFTSGIILSFIALWLLQMLILRRKYLFMHRALLYIFVVAFSLAVGAVWELCEYTVDDIFHTNNQQYMATTRATIVSSDDEPLEGHDALADTMKDLALDLAGAILVVCYECSKKEITQYYVSKKD